MTSGRHKRHLDALHDGDWPPRSRVETKMLMLESSWRERARECRRKGLNEAAMTLDGCCVELERARKELLKGAE